MKRLGFSSPNRSGFAKAYPGAITIPSRLDRVGAEEQWVEGILSQFVESIDDPEPLERLKFKDLKLVSK